MGEDYKKKWYKLMWLSIFQTLMICMLMLMLYHSVNVSYNLVERIESNYSSIPSYQEVINFCKDKGYTTGWLSSSEDCDRGINCNKDVLARDTKTGEVTKFVENKCFN